MKCEYCKKPIKWYQWFTAYDETINYYGSVFGRYYDYNKTYDYHKQCFKKRSEIK